jgi:hypothetical protein
MNNLVQLMQTISVRNKLLSNDLKSMKNELEAIFENKVLEAGVVTPGYFHYFLPTLDNYKYNRIITSYHISEEQYSDGTTGQNIKIPIVDVMSNGNSIRIFITPRTFLRNLKLEHLLNE